MVRGCTSCCKLASRSRVLSPRSSVLGPQSLFLGPHSLILNPWSSVLIPQSVIRIRWKPKIWKQCISVAGIVLLPKTLFTAFLSRMLQTFAGEDKPQVVQPWYGMVWYGVAWCGMLWYGMVWYGMVMVWYGMVWYSKVWYAMVWYGMVGYGMVWWRTLCWGMIMLLLSGSRLPAEDGHQMAKFSFWDTAYCHRMIIIIRNLFWFKLNCQGTWLFSGIYCTYYLWDLLHIITRW